MKRSSIAGAAALLVLSSSVALGAVLRHMEYNATVAGMAGAPVHGTANMKSTADDKGTEVTLKLMGDAAAGAHPWHVHTGSCAKPGGIWAGAAKAYTPISTDAKGGGESKAMIPMAVPDTGSYYVNVHESSTNMSKAIACGDLKMKM